MVTNPQARMTRLSARIDAGTLAAFDRYAEARGGVVQNLCYFGHRRERQMPFMKYTPEEIIGKLREAEIVLAQGGTTTDAWRHFQQSG